MKKQLTAVALAGLCLLTSCGEKSAGDRKSSNRAVMSENSYADSDRAYEEYSESYAETNAGYEESQDEPRSDEAVTAEPLRFGQSDAVTINPQMLVYSCDMSIDVLEFDASVEKLHDLIGKYQGFIEHENYSDGGSTTQWRYTDDQKWKTLNAVIRVPSASYDNFCKDAEQIGDMRKKNAAVQNLTAEYTDLNTTLSIYEAKEKRYIEILSELTSESDAIAVENELTEIQIEIARIKTRMNNIENDVAYSYINLTLNEVREYAEEPVIEETDTFGKRLKNTLSRTWSGFLEFLEGMLFGIISLLPYLILIVLGVIVILIIRKIMKRKKKASRAPAQSPYPVQINAKPVTQAPETPEKQGSEK
ncbi:MAG: DUF4349 domain-containing protein [Oscillospiraceae bacterium]|nr:DUF4349 domain-containing protein [Oscillospiraceae bacterium]